MFNEGLEVDELKSRCADIENKVIGVFTKAGTRDWHAADQIMAHVLVASKSLSYSICLLLVIDEGEETQAMIRKLKAEFDAGVERAVNEGMEFYKEEKKKLGFK